MIWSARTKNSGDGSGDTLARLIVVTATEPGRVAGIVSVEESA